MKLKPWLASLLVLFVTIGAVPGQQQTPRLIPFQGRLTDSAGTAVPDGVKIIQFQIYDEPTGGQALWAGEVHRTTVNGGLVNVMLGSRNPLPANRADRPDRSFFDAALYLQITVDGNEDGAIDKADPPLLPRQSILPVIFSQEAGNTRLLAGHDWSDLFGVNNPQGNILSAKIAPGSITSNHIERGAVTSNQIASATINGSLIGLGSISTDQLAVGSIDLARLAQVVAEALVPPGTIVAFGGDISKVPDGWLLCAGQSFPTNQYKRLFEAIGTAWGSPVSSHFNLPELRGMFLRGVSGSQLHDPDRDERTRSNPGGNLGPTVGSVQGHQFQNHSHTVSGALSPGSGGVDRIIAPGGLSRPTTGRYSWLTSSEGGGSETRPRNAYVHYIIKY